jgi:hypothetical protein
MATRSTAQQRPTRPPQTAEEKTFFIGKIKQRIAELDAFDPTTIQQRYGDPQVIELDAKIKKTLADAFGQGTINYGLYSGVRLDCAPPITIRRSNYPAYRNLVGNDSDDSNDLNEVIEAITEAKNRWLALLNAAVSALEEELEYAQIPALINQPTDEAASRSQGSSNQNHIYVTGANARLNLNSNDQSTNTVNNQTVDFELLAQEFQKLCQALVAQAKDDQDQIIISAIAAAEEAAKEKDDAKILKALSALGRGVHWVLKVAEGIGVFVATKYLEKHLL